MLDKIDKYFKAITINMSPKLKKTYVQGIKGNVLIISSKQGSQEKLKEYKRTKQEF